MNNKTFLAVAAVLSLALMAPSSQAGGLFKKKDSAEKEQSAAEQDKSQKWEADYIRRNIVRGKTTMDDIRAIWGRPTDVAYDGDGIETWWYEREKSGARGVLTKLRRVASPFTGDAARAVRKTDNAVDTVDQGRDLSREATDKNAVINHITLNFDEKGVVSEVTFNNW